MTDELGMVEINRDDRRTRTWYTNERRRTDELDIQKTNEDELGMVEIDSRYRDDRRTWYCRNKRKIGMVADKLELNKRRTS